MRFELVPPLGESEMQAVQAALAAAGIAPAVAPTTYRSAWRTAGIEEAAGYEADDSGTDLLHAAHQPVGRAVSSRGAGADPRYARSPRSTRGATRA